MEGHRAHPQLREQPRRTAQERGSHQVPKAVQHRLVSEHARGPAQAANRLRSQDNRASVTAPERGAPRTNPIPHHQPINHCSPGWR